MPSRIDQPQTDHGQSNGMGQLLADHGTDRTLRPDVGAEIAGHDIPEKPEILQEERLIHAHQGAEFGAHFRCRPGPQRDSGGISRHEVNRRQQHQHRQTDDEDGKAHAFDGVEKHRPLSGYGLAGKSTVNRRAPVLRRSVEVTGNGPVPCPGEHAPTVFEGLAVGFENPVICGT